MSYSELIADLLRRVERLEAAPRTFLTPDEITVLTGRKSKSRQIEALRAMSVPFFVNGIGHAVVARSTVEGGKSVIEPLKKEWIPPGLRKS
ncbi:DUF4224 domain-containing protein [Duganella sp. CT11-25]|uniref:DUF4224 domain-containing protein n=1 Tax=unclassified Duganella TaxID=2636909 RepID=UPI0039AF0573